MFTIISRSVCQTANFCRHVQISQLNLIPKLKDIFKTVKKKYNFTKLKRFKGCHWWLWSRAIGIKAQIKCSQIYWYIFLWSTLKALFCKLRKWFPDFLAEYIKYVLITGLHHLKVIIVTLSNVTIYVLYSFISGSIVGKEV